MIWLAAVAVLALLLKVCHDQCAYERAWRAKRQRFYDWCDR